MITDHALYVDLPAIGVLQGAARKVTPPMPEIVRNPLSLK